MNTLILGAFRGDEGKGKIVDYYTKYSGNLVIRFNGSCNAGHTLVRNGKELVLHQIPSAIISGIPCIIAHGCLVNLKKLLNEIEEVEKWSKDGLIDLKGKTVRDLLKVAYGCHLIQDKHIQLDIEREETGKGNGSTRQGISPAYGDKYLRSGIRIYDSEEAKNALNGMLIDDTTYLNSIELKNIMFEGAQGVMLDIDSAYYPNVSSSSVGIGGVLTGTGINFDKLLADDIFEVVGIVKAYMTSVGVGYFPTEIKEDNTEYDLEHMRKVSKEYGATTGRPRKIGFLDLPMLQYSIHISGIQSVVLTRLDTVREMFNGKKIPVCTNYMLNNEIIPYNKISLYDLEKYTPIYEYLPCWKSESKTDVNFMNFIEFINNQLFNLISEISIGQGKDDIIEYCNED
jgi:adenylosuccinate synthase